MTSTVYAQPIGSYLRSFFFPIESTFHESKYFKTFSGFIDAIRHFGSLVINVLSSQTSSSCHICFCPPTGTKHVHGQLFADLFSCFARVAPLRLQISWQILNKTRIIFTNCLIWQTCNNNFTISRIERLTHMLTMMHDDDIGNVCHFSISTSHGKGR